MEPATMNSAPLEPTSYYPSKSNASTYYRWCPDTFCCRSYWFGNRLIVFIVIGCNLLDDSK